MHKLIIAAVVAVGVMVPTSAAAQQRDGCRTVDYQGASAEVCPDRVPDLTNCYWGDYQGAPIEICLATGEKLPEGSTIDGEPVEYHTSAGHVAPVAEVAPTAAPVVESAPVAVGPPWWVEGFQAALVANGGW